MGDKTASQKVKTDSGSRTARESSARDHAPAKLPVSSQLPGILQRAQAAPESLDYNDLCAVQSAVGMRSTQRWLAGVTRVGTAPNTPHTIQSKVDPRASLQRLLAARGLNIQTHLTVGAADDPYEREADRVAAQVMRSPDGLQSQGQSAGGSFQVGNDFEQHLNSASSSGSPLPDHTRQFMESRMGADFSGVRVHTGSASAELNRAVSAEAC